MTSPRQRGVAVATVQCWSSVLQHRMWLVVAKCIMDLSVCFRRRETVDMCKYTSPSSLSLFLSLPLSLSLPPSFPPSSLFSLYLYLPSLQHWSAVWLLCCRDVIPVPGYAWYWQILPRLPSHWWVHEHSPPSQWLLLVEGGNCTDLLVHKSQLPYGG